MIEPLQEGVRVDLSEGRVTLLRIENLSHGLLDDLDCFFVHLLRFHGVFHVQFVLRQAVELDHISELLHVFLHGDFRLMEQKCGQNRHFDLIEPIESPLDGRIWEDVVQGLCDLSLHVDRLEFVHELG